MRHFKKTLRLLVFTLLYVYPFSAICNWDPNDPLVRDMMALQAAQNSMGGSMPMQGTYPQQSYPQQPMYPAGYQAGYPAQQMPNSGMYSQPMYNQPMQMQPQATNTANPYQQAQPYGMGAAPSAGAAPVATTPIMPPAATQQALPGNNISQNIGAMTAETANATFKKISASTSPLDTPKQFNTTLKSLEKAFNQCNFSRPSTTNASLTPATLVSEAIRAVRRVLSKVDTTWDKVQRKLARAVTENELDATPDKEDQDKWLALAYALAAAISNPTFLTTLKGKTMTSDAKYLWEACVKVFSIQPASLRRQNAAGDFIEDAQTLAEKKLIAELFKAETLLSEAHALTVGTKEEQAFVTAVRLFSGIVIRPEFTRSSIGLHMFAFWIFQNGIMNWIKDLGPINKKHDELWIVSAEAFNLMYSAIVTSNSQPATSLSSYGTDRTHGLPSDHLYCDLGNGTFVKRLKETQLAKFTTDFQKLAEEFTKHLLTVGGQAGLIAKNIDELRLMMLCAEACEYLLTEVTAPEAADLITYFFENGFKFNRGTVNYNAVKPSLGSLPGVVLDRLYQKTATTATFKILSRKRTSVTGGDDYATAEGYQSLAQAFTTIIAVMGQDLAVRTKFAPLTRKIEENSDNLTEFMSKREDLKDFVPRDPKFPILTAQIAASQQQYPAAPAMMPMRSSTPMAPAASMQMRTGIKPYVQQAYPQRSPAAYGQQQYAPNAVYVR